MINRPVEELEAARDFHEDLMQPSRRVVHEAKTRADYCIYSTSIGLQSETGVKP